MKMRFAVLFVILSVLLASCGFLPPEDDAPFNGIAYPIADPEELPHAPAPRLPAPMVSTDDWADDGILRLPMRVPLTLNPLLNRDATVARVLGLIFEPLAVLDSTMRPVGHLAELEFALDFSSVVITIRSEAIWSDGLPVTSDDLIFSIETLTRAPEDAIYRKHADNIAEIQRISERTVQISFVEATPAAGYSLLFPVIPRHYFQGETNPASPRNLAPLGNGAFLFDSLVPLQSMTLKRNPYTFRTRASIEEIEVLFLPDAQIDVYAFERGLVDAIRMPFPEWARNPTAKELHVGTFPVMYFEFIGFNFTQEMFQRLEIRQGIAHAFDADEAVATLYLHHAQRASAPIHPSGWMFDPSVQGLPHDNNRARMLLRPLVTARAASSDEEYPAPLIILVGEESPERVAIAYRLAAGLNAAGFADIGVEVHAVSGDEFLTRLIANDFCLFIGWMELSPAPDFAFLFNGEHTTGVQFGSDPYLESLFAATRVAATESAFIQAMSQLQHAFAARLPVLGLSFRHSAVLTSARTHMQTPPPANAVFLYVNEWKISGYK
ncbi:MAG: ABC transporter substrate-binding protein [Defluviitaleaceae bacterium]|nr:ABC transporter substrate-binding protein [Defluviitaleaceae bacterium]MCL2273742.1 ABC transporter substrate-binding protein [Defluviitaleaceae bacterium]